MSCKMGFKNHALKAFLVHLCQCLKLAKTANMLVYPSLDYELNTQVRIHREANGYTQEEFAFLIGRDVADVVKYEDLTTTDAYDFNHINRYARVLHRVPIDFVFEESPLENDIKIEARNTEYKTKTTYRGEPQIMI